LAKDAPANAADRAKNTVYLGNQTKTISAASACTSPTGLRRGGLGAGGRAFLRRPGITYDATLADGSKLVGDEVVSALAS